MTRRLVITICIVVLVCSAALASAPMSSLPHSNAPYYHGHDDGPISMAIAPDGTLWAVWSYSTGSMTDIAVSHSIGNTWAPPVLLGYENGRTDLDPCVAFTANGVPVVAWWTEQTPDELPQVMTAFLMEKGWTRPAPFSDPDRASSHPAFVPGNGELSIVFTSLDPITGEGVIDIRPISEPVPGGGTNGPDPIPTIGVPLGGEQPSAGGTVETKE